MRCLHCGKELALFKRLTGGGEFCSEAHRQKYQEEYNQLALSRLLQASPAGDAAAPAKSSLTIGRGELDAGHDRGRKLEVAEEVHEDAPVAVSNGSNGTNGSYHFDDRGAHHEPESLSVSYEPEPEYPENPAVEEEAPAAPSGFLVEIFQPHMPPEAAMAVPEAELVWADRPALPDAGTAVTLEAQPDIAGALPLENTLNPQDYRGNPRASSVEVREMSRGAANVSANFPEVVITGLEGTDRKMEVPFSSHPPDASPTLWEEPPQSFAGFQTELGDLARLAYATLGWDEIAAKEGLAGLEVPTSAPPPSEPSSQMPIEAAPVAVDEPLKTEPLAEQIAAEPIIAEQIVPEPEPEPQAPVEEPVPGAVTKPLPMTLHGHTPGRGKPVQVFPSAIARTATIQVPRMHGLPLRPSMVFGPAPAPTPAPAPVQAKAPAAEPPKQATPAAIKRETAAPAARPDIKTLIKPAIQVKPIQPEKKDPEKKEPEKGAASTLVSPGERPKPVVTTVRKAEERKPEVRRPEVRKAEEAKIEDKKAEERRAEEEQKAAEARKAEEARLEEKKAEERKAAEARKDEEARKAEETRKTEDARKAEEAKKADEARKEEARKEEERKAAELRREEARKTDKRPERKEEPSRKESVVEMRPRKEMFSTSIDPPLTQGNAQMDLGLPSLGLEKAEQGFWAKLPVFAKASIAAAVLVLGVGVYFFTSKSSDADNATKGPVVVAAGNVLSSGGAGWDTDWAPDPPTSKRQRRISLMHASQSLSDYRMELEGQIESKAMGWVFRAANPKNFYVEKIEIVKPGLEPKIQLVRFSVIDGVESAHQNVPLTLAVRPDTMYKIRFEAIGDRFTTWLLDQKVDEWTDSHISSGGVGLYAEAGESVSLKGSLNVVPLVVKR